MGDYGVLADLIRRARHRYVFHELLRHACLALAVAFGGFTLLILLGTRILEPAWVIGVAVVSFAIGAWRLRGAMLSDYQLAQRLDHRLDLQDSLSTAVYFFNHPERIAAPEVFQLLRGSVEDSARRADLGRALPFLAPRSLYAGSGLALLAVTLFGVRYGVTHTLDLQPSLISWAWDALPGVSRETASAQRAAIRQAKQQRLPETAVTTDPWQPQVLDSEGAPDGALRTVETPEVNNSRSGEGQPKSGGAESKDKASDSAESAGGEKSADGSQSPGDNSPLKGQQSSASKQSSDARQQTGSGENSSLTGKMRDAFSSLMAKLNLGQKPSAGNQSPSQSQNSQQQAQDPQNGNQEKGAPSPGQPQSESSASAESQGDQDSQSGDKAQAAQSQNSSKGSDKSRAQDGKSGAGKQDGDKSAQEAMQLAAMGKISELVGKRNQNVTGEIMVEVASGKQQLKTQYSERRAAPNEAGGEINRDEVPLVYQRYVQQYFEEIRKLPAPAKAAKKPVGVSN